MKGSLILFLVVAFTLSNAYQHKKEEGMDYVSGLITEALLELEEMPEFGFDEIVNLTRGLLHGLNSKREINNSVICFEHLPKTYKQIETAIKEIRDTDWQDTNKIIDALVKVIRAVQEIVKTAIPCIKITSEVKMIVKRLSDLTWIKLLERLKAKIWAIINDIITIVKAFGKKDYYTAGKHIGTILYDIFLAL